MSKVHSGMRFHALSSFITEKFTGRNISSLHRPFFCGEPLASIVHPRLQPSFQLAAEARVGIDLFEYGCMINPVKAFFDVGV